MNVTSATLADGESEADIAGLPLEASDKVAAPRVANAPAAMECKLVDIRRLEDADGTETKCWFVIGQVVRIHIDKVHIRDGMVDQLSMGLVSRLGYFDYAQVDNVFAMPRPRSAHSTSG